MSQTDVSYSCGSCGYHLNLTSSNRVTSSIGSRYSKTINKGSISFRSIDPSRFTQVDQVNCLPISWGRYRSKSKLLCRNCGVLIGYGYGDSTALCGLESPTSSGSAYKKIVLQSLSLSGCIELPDSGLSMLLNYGLKLESLHLDCCFGITDHGLSFVAGGCPLLTTISLYRCIVTDIGLEVLSQSCLTLKDVNLSYCSLISDQGIRALFQNCRHLRSIGISHCRNITGVGFQGCSQTLAYLEADSCKLEPEGILAIVSGGGLEYLNISNLAWCIHGHGLATIDARFISKLRVLNFRLCRTIDDDAIVKIAKGCPLLEEWNLALCHEISILGWKSIGSKCRNLERLHVNRCRNLCDQGLLALRNGCRRLRKLYLGRCPLVSSTAIEMFKCLRSDVQIIDEEIMCIGPDGAFR
ncbi:UNVERIFIED_CONTAM: F-box/LRR-repeat protein 12 [Sesamum radiatum]|uniref:F-box/LRR-repeat protein 12 n=1 Tax=Sesamum radiatum TaxID=300843 RepID=A0AAW2W946_SESRA